MVSIIIISHSKTLAEGVKELAVQMSQNKVIIEAVGGIVEDGVDKIGTNPQAIFELMQTLGAESEVLVLMDIGSAIMSAEIAKEMLPAEIEQNIYLCEAPLVEGAIAAAAQAMVGAEIIPVLAEAHNALLGKTMLLKPSEPTEQNATTPKPATNKVYESFDLLVPNQLGLHARPAVRLVEIVNRYEADILLSKTNDNFVSAKSISQVGTIGALKGDTLHFKIAGKEVDQIIKALKDFQKNNFGDDEQEKSSDVENASITITDKTTDADNGIIQGIAASKGIAIGKVKLIKQNIPVVKKEIIKDAKAETELFELAIKNVIQNLKITKTTLQVADKKEAQIFDFHILFLEDRGFIQKVIEVIQNENINAAFAWKQTIQNVKNQYLNMQSQYLQERIVDINEIDKKVLTELTGDKTNKIELTEPCILAVEELGPAETINLDKSKVLGIVTAKGGITSHTSILSRSLGIPAIVNIGSAINYFKDNEEIAMDGTIGKIWIGKKHASTLLNIKKQKEIETQRLAQLLVKAQNPAITKNNKQISILANVSSPEEAEVAYKNGAEGIGLYRTEFLFMNRDKAPDEAEQYETYRAVAANMKGYPVTIRTLDVGGDKPIPYLNIEKEKNPFLGLRGVRYCLQDVALFKTQLRAICRVSAEFPVKIMFPMIGVPEEVASVKDILKDVQQELSKEQIPYNLQMPVGIMIEVPSTIFQISDLSKALDFFSIGTNDLTQYLLAVDRENEAVAKYRSALHPSVLQAINHILQHSEIEVGMCGELAGNPLATNLLLAFGLEKFSMNSPIIPSIKEIVRQYDALESDVLIAQFEKLNSLEEVTGLLKNNQPLLA